MCLLDRSSSDVKQKCTAIKLFTLHTKFKSSLFLLLSLFRPAIETTAILLVSSSCSFAADQAAAPKTSIALAAALAAALAVTMDQQNFTAAQKNELIMRVRFVLLAS